MSRGRRKPAAPARRVHQASWLEPIPEPEPKGLRIDHLPDVAGRPECGLDPAAFPTKAHRLLRPGATSSETCLTCRQVIHLRASGGM